MSEPILVSVVCGACDGTGETEGYPGYAPQGGPDGAKYVCYACHGAKVRQATLSPESREARELAVGRWHIRMLWEAGYREDSAAFTVPQTRAILGHYERELLALYAPPSPAVGDGKEEV